MAGSKATFRLSGLEVSCWSGYLPSDLRSSDLDEVGGHDAPSDPPSEAVFAVVQADIQVLAALQDADPPLDAGPKPEPSSEPVLTFVFSAFR